MPRKGSCVYSVSELKRLWAAGKTHQQIAAALGCSEMYVSQLRQRHNLPFRRKKYYGPKEKDPTPEEIAERAAECRAKRKVQADHTPDREVRQVSYDERLGLYDTNEIFDRLPNDMFWH